MRYPVVLDLETKHSFRQYADPKQLGISVVGIYNYASHRQEAFFERDLHKLYPILENASYIIGFNINSFDLPVLQAYYPGKVQQFATFDILDDIKRILGRRLALNDIVSGTLKKKKSGHGLQAIEFFKEGRFEELRRYCLDDVVLTKEMFEYGASHGEIFFHDAQGIRAIKVSWKQYQEGKSDTTAVSLTLPF